MCLGEFSSGYIKVFMSETWSWILSGGSETHGTKFNAIEMLKECFIKLVVLGSIFDFG